MLTAYLIATAFGGTLLTASVVLGGKDADHGGGEAHADHGGHNGDQGMADAAAFAWLPASSLRFWTFFLTFGGGVGTALTLLGSPASVVLVMCAAVVIGWASGAGAVTAVRMLSAKAGDSATSPAELVGATGQLLLAAGPDEPGKVRLDVKGRIQDFVAISDEVLATGEKVMVVSSQPDGRLVVTKNDET